MKHLTRIAARLFDTPLMIQEQKLGTILSILGPRLYADEVSEEEAQAIAEQLNPTPIAAVGGDQRERKPYGVTPDGIAVLSVEGPLVRSASWIEAVCGITSYDSIRAQFRDAMSDDSIKGIMLDIDSPGGECAGLFDLADEIAAARSVKPIWASADDCAFSAAYALASSASKIWITRTGGVGSIGVIMMHCDQSQLDAKVGLKYTAIYAGQKKTNFSPHQPLSEEAESEAQTNIDRLYGMFTSLVATNRNMAVSAVKKTEAGLYWGENGVNAGLADQVGTLEDALAAMASEIAGPAKSPASAASAETALPSSTTEEPKTMARPNKVKADAAEINAASEDDLVLKPGAAAKADDEEMSEDDDDDVCEDDDDEEEEAAPKQKKKAAKSSVLTGISQGAALRGIGNVDAVVVSEMCELAGLPNMTTKMLKFAAKGASVSQIREKLQEARVDEQAASGTINSLVGRSYSGVTVGQIEAQAAQSALRNGTTKAQEFNKMIKANPQAYEHYLAVEKPAMAAQLRRSNPRVYGVI